MLYHALPAFEKHLAASGPDHFAPIYLVALPYPDERRHLLLQIGKRSLRLLPDLSSRRSW